jgi:hypothetical protein
MGLRRKIGLRVFGFAVVLIAVYNTRSARRVL